MLNILIVGLGGFIGAVSRYYIGTVIQNNYPESSFPYGTITVNLIGCLLIGFLSGFLGAKNLLSESVRLFLFIGILGGFTTFSAFGLETLNLLNKGQLFAGTVYVSISVVFGLAFVWLGHSISKLV